MSDVKKKDVEKKKKTATPIKQNVGIDEEYDVCFAMKNDAVEITAVDAVENIKRPAIITELGDLVKREDILAVKVARVDVGSLIRDNYRTRFRLASGLDIHGELRFDEYVSTANCANSLYVSKGDRVNNVPDFVNKVAEDVQMRVVEFVHEDRHYVVYMDSQSSITLPSRPRKYYNPNSYGAEGHDDKPIGIVLVNSCITIEHVINGFNVFVNTKITVGYATNVMFVCDNLPWRRESQSVEAITDSVLINTEYRGVNTRIKHAMIVDSYFNCNWGSIANCKIINATLNATGNMEVRNCGIDGFRLNAKEISFRGESQTKDCTFEYEGPHIHTDSILLESPLDFMLIETGYQRTVYFRTYERRHRDTELKDSKIGELRVAVPERSTRHCFDNTTIDVHYGDTAESLKAKLLAEIEVGKSDPVMASIINMAADATYNRIVLQRMVDSVKRLGA